MLKIGTWVQIKVQQALHEILIYSYYSCHHISSAIRGPGQFFIGELGPLFPKPRGYTTLRWQEKMVILWVQKLNGTPLYIIYT